MRFKFVAAALLALGLSASPALAQGQTAQGDPDLSAMSAAELTAFTRAMPKGGDLHVHLSGAPFPETYLRWAAEDGLCVDTVALAIAPCTPQAPTLRPAAEALGDYELYSRMLDSLSTRRPDHAGRSGHDQFFTAFDRFGATPPERAGDMLADLTDRMARENAFYLEVMITPQSGPARALGREIGWREDLGGLRDALAPRLEPLVAAAMAETDRIERRAREVLRCGTTEQRPGCAVTVRYLAQSNRLGSPEQVFAQVQLGAMMVRRDPRWVGVQLVAPEDHPNALNNYSTHMRIVGFLTDQGRSVPVALHAGELTLAYATPADLSFHVRDAVRVAGARRIGHGVSIPHEDDALGLVGDLADRRVLVEVNLTSNDVILGVEGPEHPSIWLRGAGVPLAYTTDDPGISRIDLSHEYARAVRDTGATYADLRRAARNAIAFSFLPGEGLWQDPGTYARPAAPCANAMGREHRSLTPCARFLAGSEKARAQWELDRRLHAFERDWRVRTARGTTPSASRR